MFAAQSRLCVVWTACFSLISDEADHIEFDVAVVPNIQVSVLWAVREHCQYSTSRPQVKGHIDWLSLQQIKRKGDSGVLGVGDIQDATGNEGVASFGARISGVYVGCDGEGLLVQLGHCDALIYAGRKDQPQAVLIYCQLEVGLRVMEQIGKFVVQRVFYSESLKSFGTEVISGNAGSPSDVIIEGTVVDGVAAALVELSNVHSVTAAVLEGGNAFILLHHTTRKVFCHPHSLIVQMSGVFHPCAKCGFHLCHISEVDQRLNQALILGRLLE